MGDEILNSGANLRIDRDLFCPEEIVSHVELGTERTFAFEFLNEDGLQKMIRGERIVGMVLLSLFEEHDRGFIIVVVEAREAFAGRRVVGPDFQGR